MIGKIVGICFLLFVIIIGSLLAIQAYSATDNRAEVSDEFSGAYNATRPLAAVSINFMNVLDNIRERAER